jgi:glucose/mannose-6-phosphate isomerase
MTSILDSRDEIKKLDISNLLGSAEALPDQIQDAWDQTQNIKFPSSYPNIKNIVVSGMGGSALGSLIIKRLFKDELTLPLKYILIITSQPTSSDSLVLALATQVIQKRH